MKLMKLLVIISFAPLLSGCLLGDSRYDLPDEDPNEIYMKMKKSEYFLDDTFTVDVVYSFDEDVSEGADIEVLTTGALQIKDSNFHIFALDSKENGSFSFELDTIDVMEGEGIIGGSLNAHDETGKYLYSAWAPTISYYIADSKIYFGTLGLYDLKIKHLEDIYAQGKLSYDEYIERLDELSREGSVIETIKSQGE